MAKVTSEQLGTQPIGPLLIRQAVPAAIGILVMSLNILVDTIFVGNWIGSIAIAAIHKGSVQESPVTPCGACRQVLYEKELQGEEPMELILYGSKKIQVINRVTDLLPLPFTLEALS